ncbi:MAG: hypothetical protein KDH88_19735 [Chromatiales bacterium]|nr:hypothetical protein [Chromatiales bacterium]
MHELKVINTALPSGKRRKPGRPKREVGPDLSGFLQRILHHPNSQEAIEAVKDQAGLAWDRLSGAELITVTQEAEAVEDEVTNAKRDLDELEISQRATSRTIPASQFHTGKDEAVVSFSDWDGRDRFYYLLFGLLTVACMAMGWSNLYVNLMASGEPVFIENFWLAAALAAISPLAAVAVERLSHLFVTDRARQRYTKAIFGLTVIVLAAWSVLFVHEYPGVTSPVLFAGEGFDAAPFLTWAQIALEILVASCLWLAADQIHSKYAPGWVIENPEFREQGEAITALRARLGALRQRYGALIGRRAVLEADRQAFINAQVAEFQARKARFHAQFDFSD